MTLVTTTETATGAATTTTTTNQRQQQKQLLAKTATITAAAATESAAAGQSTTLPHGANQQQPSHANANVAAAPLSPEAVHGHTIFQHNACETCHGVDGLQGTAAAPGLAGTASILPAATLDSLLRHHSKQMLNGGMPLTNVNATDLKALVAYIRSMPTQ